MLGRIPEQNAKDIFSGEDRVVKIVRDVKMSPAFATGLGSGPRMHITVLDLSTPPAMAERPSGPRGITDTGNLVMISRNRKCGGFTRGYDRSPKSVHKCIMYRHHTDDA